MYELTGLLAMMFFIALGVALVGGCLFVLLDVVLQSQGSDDSES